MDKAPDRKATINWKLWAGILISVLAVYLALRHVDLGMIWRAISQCSIFYLVLAALMNLLQLVIRAWRWKILLSPIRKTGFYNRLMAVTTGFAANYVLPARLGEFIRADQLGEREQVSKSSVFATIVVERLLDGFTLLMVLVIGIMGVSFPEDMGAYSAGLRSAGFTLFISYSLIILFLVGFRLRPGRYLAIFGRTIFFLPEKVRIKLLDMVDKFGHGLAPVRGLCGWGMVIFYSVLLWSLSLFQILFVSHSINLSLPFISLFIILSMAVFGVMIPSAPGFIGSFHLAVQYGFIFLGVSREMGLSAAILYHASFFFPTILFGLIAYILTNRGRRKQAG